MMNEQQQSEPSVSVARVLTMVIPLVLIAAGAYVWSRNLDPNAKNELANASFPRIRGSNWSLPWGAPKLGDKHGNLVADSPEHPKQCIDPKVLEFSFVASETDSVPEESWKELFVALKKTTGRDVKYVHYNTVEEQLAA